MFTVSIVVETERCKKPPDRHAKVAFKRRCGLNARLRPKVHEPEQVSRLTPFPK